MSEKLVLVNTFADVPDALVRDLEDFVTPRLSTGRATIECDEMLKSSGCRVPSKDYTESAESLRHSDIKGAMTPARRLRHYIEEDQCRLRESRERDGFYDGGPESLFFFNLKGYDRLCQQMGVSQGHSKSLAHENSLSINAASETVKLEMD